MAEQLKPCPHCGNAAHTYQTMDGLYAAGCNLINPTVPKPCGIVVVRYEKQDAIGEWNRRSDE